MKPIDTQTLTQAIDTHGTRCTYTMTFSVSTILIDVRLQSDNSLVAEYWNNGQDVRAKIHVHLATDLIQ